MRDPASSSGVVLGIAGTVAERTARQPLRDDSRNGEAVMELIRSACARGVAAVVVTHDAHLAAWASRIVSIRDGHLIGGASHDPFSHSGTFPEVNR